MTQEKTTEFNLSDFIEAHNPDEYAININNIKEFIRLLFEKRRKEKGDKYGQEVIDVEELLNLAGDKLNGLPQLFKGGEA